MLKLTAVVSLMLIGSGIWAAGISCDSCGSECASACGTRHFRSCCFNYLRKKREPENDKIWPQVNRDTKETPGALNRRNPLVVVENVASVPESWMPMSHLLHTYNQPSLATTPLRSVEDLDNRVQYIYD